MSSVRVRAPLPDNCDSTERLFCYLLIRADAEATARKLSSGLLLDRRLKLYCNMRCQHDHVYRRLIDAWLIGVVSGMNKWGHLSETVRRYLIEKYRGCVRCGWAERNPITGKIPLHIDHIDGDWRNNRPENLRLLCPNHHALTANYG